MSADRTNASDGSHAVCLFENKIMSLNAIRNVGILSAQQIMANQQGCTSCLISLRVNSNKLLLRQTDTEVKKS